ncbi:MAG: head-tail connector protein [Pseudomonadota bacterium]
MPLSVISQPAALPVTLVQLKQHLRIDHDTEDTFLLELASAATQHVESEVGQNLIERTLRQYLDALPANREIRLQAWPVKHIETVIGYGVDGTPVTVDPGHYSLSRSEDPAMLAFSDAPGVADFENGLEIDFVSGFGSTGLDIPSNIIRAILVLCAHWYENRGVYSSGLGIEIVPEGLQTLLKPARRVKL